MEKVKNILHSFARFVEILTVLCFILLGGVTLYRIFGRWFGLNNLAWTDEMITIFTTWMVFLGYAYLCEYDTHVSVTVFHDYAPETVKKICYVLIRIANIACGIFIGYSAYVWTRQNTTRFTSYLHLQYNIWQNALWICSIVFAIFAIFKFVEQIIDLFGGSKTSD